MPLSRWAQQDSNLRPADYEFRFWGPLPYPTVRFAGLFLQPIHRSLPSSAPLAVSLAVGRSHTPGDLATVLLGPSSKERLLRLGCLLARLAGPSHLHSKQRYAIVQGALGEGQHLIENEIR
jgi:hypothetical protein